VSPQAGGRPASTRLLGVFDQRHDVSRGAVACAGPRGDWHPVAPPPTAEVAHAQQNLAAMFDLLAASGPLSLALAPARLRTASRINSDPRARGYVFRLSRTHGDECCLVLSPLRDAEDNAPMAPENTGFYLFLRVWSIRATRRLWRSPFAVIAHGGGNRQTQGPSRFVCPRSRRPALTSLVPLRPDLEFYFRLMTGQHSFEPIAAEEYVAGCIVARDTVVAWWTIRLTRYIGRSLGGVISDIARGDESGATEDCGSTNSTPPWRSSGPAYRRARISTGRFGLGMAVRIGGGGNHCFHAKLRCSRSCRKAMRGGDRSIACSASSTRRRTAPGSTRAVVAWLPGSGRAWRVGGR